MKIARPRTWWQAGLMYGTGMFAWYALKHALQGDATFTLIGREFLIWEAAGVMFGLLFTAAMSLLFHRNLFRGFPERKERR